MIVCILGSSSTDSLTRKGLQALIKQAVAAGSPCDLLDLQIEFRGLHEPSEYAAPPAESQAARLRSRIADASGIVLATPVYHGTFSGLLKNALDHLHGKAFARLPVGLLAAGGGPRSASVACEHLRTVVRALGGWSTPTHVSMSYGDLIDAGPTKELHGRLASMVAELQSFSGVGA